MSRDLYRELMERPEQWPFHPYLPVKRYDEDGGLPECSVMIASCGPRVYGCTLMLAVTLPPGQASRLFHVREYASVEAMITDGWRPD